MINTAESKYNWAYETTPGDSNYNERQDKTLNWWFYDWD